jgi:hypothetical protein
VHQKKSIEERGLRLGGNVPTRQAAGVVQKERQLHNLKVALRGLPQMFLSDVYDYVKSVSFKMRQYGAGYQP